MTEEEIIIHVNQKLHPELYRRIQDNMKLFNCSTYPQLLEIMFDRTRLRNRVVQDMIEFLKDTGIVEGQ